MIGQLRGLLIKKHPPELLIEVNGVGYEVEAPMSSFYSMPETGSEVLLYTHLIVRDDAHLLFGFATESERRMFRALIRVNGVGAKMALAILSGINTDDFSRCIQEGDTGALTRLPGIGRKTAERLIIEMRDRLDKDLQELLPSKSARGALLGGTPAPVAEAITALEALGYRTEEASRMVRSVDAQNLSTEDIIRLALKATVST